MAKTQKNQIVKLKQIDNQLAQVTKGIPFMSVNPTNISEEFKIFFSKPDYNPQFRYKKINHSLDPVTKELKGMEHHDSVLGEILIQKRDNLLKKIDMIKHMDSPNFTKDSVKIFGKPDRALLKQARKILKIQVESTHEYITPEETIRRLRKILKRRGLNWVVKKNRMLAHAAVRPKKKTLFIKDDVKFSPTIINRIIIHEIGTHIFRSQNGFLQPYKIFSNGFPNYLMTEEGLAVVNEEVQGILNPRILKIYAARTIAANIALRKSFNEVYNYLIKFLPPGTAWRITARVKRGLKDTSQPGCYTKDHLYFKGYNQVKRYFQKNGDIEHIYHGKIGLEHVKLLDQIPGLVKPQYLPIFFKSEWQKEPV